MYKAANNCCDQHIRPAQLQVHRQTAVPLRCPSLSHFTMLLTTAGGLTLWAAAALSLLCLPEPSLAQQTPLGPSLAQQTPLDSLAGPARLSLFRPPAAKRAPSFRSLDCRGVFDRQTFTELVNVCQDCFSLYRSHELYGLCRSQCFTTKYFNNCLIALQQEEDSERLKDAIVRISGRK